MNRVVVVVGSAVMAYGASGQVALISCERLASAEVVAVGYYSNPSEQASDFLVFDHSRADCFISGEGGALCATAEQNSQPNGEGLQAIGQVNASMDQGDAALIQGTAISSIELRFRLDQPTPYTLRGEVVAGYASALVELRRLNGEVTHSFFETIGSNFFDVSGTLDAGEYELRVFAEAAVSAGSFFNSVGASYAVDLRIRQSACPADFNGDGFVDFFDFDDFVACFEGLACPPGQDADFNDDGFADFFDYDDFVAAFENGC